MRHDNTTEFSCSAETLWACLTDDEKLATWNPSMKTFTHHGAAAEDGNRVGIVTTVGIQEGAKIVDYDSEVMVWEPCTRLDIQLRGGNLGKGPMDVSYQLSPIAGGTALRMTTTWQPVGLLLMLMSPLINIFAARNSKHAMASLGALAAEG